MATTGARNRGKDRPGNLAWVALGGAVLVILGLTFALGMLVGRQWARQTPPALAAEPTRKAPPARRSGLSDLSADRPAAPQEKLTFYQTLTAPLGPVPVSGRADITPKTPPAAKPALPSRILAGAGSQDGSQFNSAETTPGDERHEAGRNQEEHPHRVAHDVGRRRPRAPGDDARAQPLGRPLRPVYAAGGPHPHEERAEDDGDEAELEPESRGRRRGHAVLSRRAVSRNPTAVTPRSPVSARNVGR